MRHANVVRYVSEHAWAILPTTLQTIVEIVELHAAGGSLPREEIDARLEAAHAEKVERRGAEPSERGGRRAKSVAIIPIQGVIIPRANLFSEWSGGTSVEGLRNSFFDAVEDDRVSGIVFDIDSPGGSVDLVPELAEDIRDARGEKPIVAVANTLAASAAYWIGAQADEFYVTPSGLVGSIGVYAAHLDISGYEEKEGLKTTLVSAGKFKVEGNPYEPLGEEARKAMQRLVDEPYDLFVEAIAQARGTTAQAVREGYGQGRVLAPRAALAEQLVDGIQDFETTVGNLMRGGSGRSSSSGVAIKDASLSVNGEAVALFTDDVDTALRAVETVVTRAGALRALTGSKRASLTALRDAVDAMLSAEAPTDADDDGLDLEATFVENELRLRLTV